MKGKLQRETEGERGRGRGRESDGNSSLLINASAIVLFLCPQGRRQRREGKWCTWTVFRPLMPDVWPQAGDESNCTPASMLQRLCVIHTLQDILCTSGRQRFLIWSAILKCSSYSVCHIKLKANIRNTAFLMRTSTSELNHPSCSSIINVSQNLSCRFYRCATGAWGGWPLLYTIHEEMLVESLM